MAEASSRKHRELEMRVAGVLDDLGLSYEVEPSLKGLRPDFLVHGPAGERVVVEAKAWPSDRGHAVRAADQVLHYKRATGADDAFIVLEDLNEPAPEGVVSEDGLREMLTRRLRAPSISGDPGKSASGKLSRTRKPRVHITYDVETRQTVFAAMPFASEFDDTYFVAMTHAAESIGATCWRVDHEEFMGDIVDEIKRGIRQSVAVIVDLSGSRPNVLYEAGFAHALDKPVVHICSTPLGELPFDVRNWNTIEYSAGGTSALRSPLAKRLKEILPSARRQEGEAP